MIRYRELRAMFDGRLQESRNDHRAGRLAGLRDFYDVLGLGMDSRTGTATVPLDERGLPDLRPGRARASEISLRHLAEALMGHEFVEEYYHPSGGFDFSNRHLIESAIDPTAFTNINTFNLSISGLVNAEIMERFNAPEYIGRNLVTIKPTKMNGQKLIGVARMGTATAAAKGRMPGETHAEVGFGEAYQTTPETVEQALKCRVTKEAVFFDLTGQVLDEAQAVGDELAYGQEKDIADCVMGVTAGYNRNGTSSNTYQTSSPWINDHANPFSDESDVDDARQLFVGMTDPDSGREIVINSYQILCMPARELKFREQLFGTNIQLNTQVANNVAARQNFTASQLNTVGRGTFTLTPLTAIWYNRALAATGLNLSASAAKEYWWIGDFAKAFWWMENWPLTPWMASADELVMKDQGLVAVYGANYRGKAYPREPRYVVRNKDS